MYYAKFTCKWGGGGEHTEFHPIESVIYFVNDPLPSWADLFYFVP